MTNCKISNQYIKKYEKEYLEMMSTLISENINKPWNWKHLSSNPNITLELVLQNPNKNWDWYELSKNQNITYDIVLQNPDKPWNYGGLSLNPNITFDIVLQNPDKIWNWDELSRHPNITYDMVLQNPDKKWNYYYLSGNPNITLDIILNNEDKNLIHLNFNRWDWYWLSKNPNVTIEDVLKNPHKPWSYRGLSENPNITVDIALKYSDTYSNTVRWNWYRLCANPNTKFNDILYCDEEPDIIFDWSTLGSSINITYDTVLENPNQSWNWYYLSRNPNITLDIILEHQKNHMIRHHPNKNFCNGDYVCNCIWSFNHDYSSDWMGLSKNRNISLFYVFENPDKRWNWKGLSKNKMDLFKKKYIKYLIKCRQAKIMINKIANLHTINLNKDIVSYIEMFL
jgi:hypothetical protein